MHLAVAIDRWVEAHQSQLSKSTKRDIRDIATAARDCGYGDIECIDIREPQRLEIIADADDRSALNAEAIGQFLAIVVDWGADQHDDVAADEDDLADQPESGSDRQADESAISAGLTWDDESDLDDDDLISWADDGPVDDAAATVSSDDGLIIDDLPKWSDDPPALDDMPAWSDEPSAPSAAIDDLASASGAAFSALADDVDALGAPAGVADDVDTLGAAAGVADDDVTHITWEDPPTDRTADIADIPDSPVEVALDDSVGNAVTGIAWAEPEAVSAELDAATQDTLGDDTTVDEIMIALDDELPSTEAIPAADEADVTHIWTATAPDDGGDVRATIPAAQEPSAPGAAPAAAASFLRTLESSSSAAPAPSVAPAATTVAAAATTPDDSTFGALAQTEPGPGIFTEAAQDAGKRGVDWITVLYFTIAVVCFGVVIYTYLTS